MQVEQLWLNIEQTIKVYNQSEIKEYLSIGDCYRLSAYTYMFGDKTDHQMVNNSFLIAFIFDWISVFGV